MPVTKFIMPRDHRKDCGNGIVVYTKDFSSDGEKGWRVECVWGPRKRRGHGVAMVEGLSLRWQGARQREGNEAGGNKVTGYEETCLLPVLYKAPLGQYLSGIAGAAAWLRCSGQLAILGVDGAVG